MVITRPVHESEELKARLEALGATTIVLPTIAIQPIDRFEEIDAALSAIDRFDLLVLGSKNAADALLSRARALGIVIRSRVACVGRKTEAHVARAMAEPDSVLAKGPIIVPASYRSESLVDAIARELAGRGGVAGARILFPRAPEGREILIEELERRGGTVVPLSVYRIATAHPPEPAVVESLGRADAFTFLSGETLRAFLELLPEASAREWLRSSTVAVIGPVARAKAEALGIRVDVMPEEATVEGLVEALAKALAPSGRSL